MNVHWHNRESVQLEKLNNILCNEELDTYINNIC